MGVKTSGSVEVTYRDGEHRFFTYVSNISISPDWVFLRFADGHRSQIPASIIKEIIENPDVFIKGVKEVK